jgi:hypothetical protein
MHDVPEDAMGTAFTTREVAEIFATEAWRVRRLFEDGTLAEPPRFGRSRIIPREMLPTILDELRRRGWVAQPVAPDQEPAPA